MFGHSLYEQVLYQPSINNNKKMDNPLSNLREIVKPDIKNQTNIPTETDTT